MLLLPVAIGCGGQETPHVEVIGEVTLDGEPVPQAQVYLTPSLSAAATPSDGTYAAAVTDGLFELPLQSGPPPGEYEVYVKPVEPDAEEVLQQARTKQTGLLAERKQLLNAIAKQGPIRVELVENELNDLIIELTRR